MERLKETQFGDRKFICPDANYMDEVLFGLSQEVINSGLKFDWLIAISRGGWALAPTLANDFRTKSLCSIGYESYDKTERTDVKSIIGLPESVKARLGRSNILVLEDIVDSGNTVQRVGEDLEEFKPNRIEVVVDFWNHQKSRVVPTFYALRTDCWVIFPHEQGGFIQEFDDTWSNLGMERREIRSILCSFGLVEPKVDYFMVKAKREREERLEKLEMGIEVR